ncbi:MAG: methyltransferase [Gammaproteobacteria bacterium]|nr:methyltransferase [Gammaproteobacteria bacterium]
MTALRLRYQTIEFDEVDIHIRTLRDKQQYSDPLGEAESMGISSAQWSFFGVVWEASKVLAREMADYEIGSKRILEIGCGMALSSLLLNSRHADISATDHHPQAGQFLEENVRLNGGQAIPFLRTDWKTEHDGLGKFDLIIGADLLYERDHVEDVSAFINRHAQQSNEVIMVDPGRGNRSSFSKKMTSLGYSQKHSSVEYMDEANKLFTAKILRYYRD